MTSAEIVISAVVSDIPFSDISTERLYELSDVFHGANLAAIAYGKPEDSILFSYLSETAMYCYRNRRYPFKMEGGAS